VEAGNQPASSVWVGKPDVYHAYQAALWPNVPLIPSFATRMELGLISRLTIRARPKFKGGRLSNSRYGAWRDPSRRYRSVM